jgi:hypothetical protein
VRQQISMGACWRIGSMCKESDLDCLIYQDPSKSTPVGNGLLGGLLHLGACRIASVLVPETVAASSRLLNSKNESLSRTCKDSCLYVCLFCRVFKD